MLLDARRAEKQGPAAVERRRWARLAEMVAFARANSPYYRDLYQDLPERTEDPVRLPVTSRKQLMPRFDDWVTDREVTIAKARMFVDNLDLIGEPFLKKYMVVKTTGTTGTPGVILLDKYNWAVDTAFRVRALGAWLSVGEVIRVLARGGRMAVVAVTGGHFMRETATAAIRKTRLGKTVQIFAAQTPLPELVAQLNQFQPVLLWLRQHDGASRR